MCLKTWCQYYACDRVLQDKVRWTKFAAKVWIPSIEVPLPNDSPLDLVWKLVGRKCKLLWFEGDLSPSSLDVTYECEKNDGKYCMLLFLFFDYLFFLYFWHDLCRNMSRWLSEPICISLNWFFLLEVIEENEKCGKMFKEDRMMVNGT